MKASSHTFIALTSILPIFSCAWSHQSPEFQLHPQHTPSMALYYPQSRCLNRIASKMTRSLYQPTYASRPRRTTIIPASPSCSSRLLGSKAGIPGNPQGNILLQNMQDALPSIDQERLRSNIHKIRDLIGYPTYDVTLFLVDDEFMQETNQETRGMNEPTDILSFQFHRHKANQAGVLEEPEFNIPDYYTLGEMLVDVPYVMRQCQEDKEYYENGNGENDEEEEDRGVSGAMANIYDPEERINMLLVHGMLHLVGHDHEEDDEYELMVKKEEEILEKLGMLPSKR